MFFLRLGILRGVFKIVWEEVFIIRCGECFFVENIFVVMIVGDFDEDFIEFKDEIRKLREI